MKFLLSQTIPLALIAVLSSGLAAAQVTDETENYNGNLLKYPVVALENKSVAKKINKEIAKEIENLKKQHSSLKGAADKISMSYKVLLENDARLNLLLYSWTYCNGAAHGMYHTYGLSYDLLSEKKAVPSDYIGSPEPQVLDAGVRNGIYKLTDSDNKAVNLTDFWKVEVVSNECILNEDGSLTLIYQPYDLAPYAFGNTFITIPASEFMKLSGKQPKKAIKTEKQQAKDELNAQKEAAKLQKQQAKAELDAQEKAAKLQKQQAKTELNAQEKAAKLQKQQAKAEQNAQDKAAKLQQQRDKVFAKNELKSLKEKQKTELATLKATQKEQLRQYKVKHSK